MIIPFSNRQKYESDDLNRPLDGLLNRASFLSSEENADLKSGIAES
jgi:hypothetical protein